MTSLFFRRATTWFACLLLCAVAAVLRAQTTPPGPKDAVLLTVSGKVEVAPEGSTAYAPGQSGQVLHLGDQIRTGAASRAAIRLSDKSVLRVYELTTMAIKPPAQAGHNDVIDVKSGATYFFNRDKPQETQFQTPSASGAIRGTEFNLVVREDGRTELTLLDGEVDLSNEQGAVQMKSGEEATVEKGKAPQKTAAINAVSSIQWTLYYPAILDVDELQLPADVQSTLSQSLDAYRSGDLLQALAKYPDGRSPASESERVYRAALLLAVGQVEGAGALLRDTLNEARPAALGAALQEMIASVKGEAPSRAAARTLATEWLAGSYAAQSRNNLVQALEMARSAAAKSPNFGYASERVAEMEFSFGQTLPALDALKKSLAASPQNAQALALKGFVLSAQNKISEARGYFEQAVAADGALANGWLGRGLTKIKAGEIDGGRKDLETAAALEPTRAFLRSYLAKAWSLNQPGQYAWNTHLATNELAQAKHLDPNDPTAWLYSALLNDQRNCINQALSDLEHSEDLNQNRAVFRSKFLLDQDQAVRGANLALIYRDAGFTDVAVREATKAVENDYANYSAHLFLSDSYNALLDPRKSNVRYETAWENELLLADLLAPVGAGVVSQTVSQQEYSRLFEADRVGVSSQTEYWSRGAWLESASLFGAAGNLAYSLDGYYYSDQGIRPNNDFVNYDFSITLKYQVTPKDTVFLELERTDLRSGDTGQYYNDYDPTVFSSTIRSHDMQDPNVVFGYHRNWSPGNDTLLLYRNLQDTFTLTDPAFPIPSLGIGGTLYNTAYKDEGVLNSIELQHVLQTDMHRFIVGARYQYQSDNVVNNLFVPPPRFLNLNYPTTVQTEFSRVSLYAYYSLKLWDSLRATAGVNYDNQHFPRNIANVPVENTEDSRERISPKLGIDWTGLPGTRVRAAYTRSQSGLFNSSSTLIEPSEVAGFNQSYRTLLGSATVPGTEFESWSLGVDHKFPTRTYVAVEGQLLNSTANQDLGAFQRTGVFPPAVTGIPLGQTLDYKEKNIAFNVNQLIGDIYSVGLSYRLINADVSYANQVPAGVLAVVPKRFQQSTLHEVSLFGNVNLPCGFYSQLQANWWDQANSLFVVNEPGNDFWQFNAFLGYRFARRHAEIQVGVLNIADQDYRLDPLTYYLEQAHTRTFVTSLKFNF